MEIGMRVFQEEDTLSYSSETGRTLNCLLSPLLYRLLLWERLDLEKGVYGARAYGSAIYRS